MNKILDLYNIKKGVLPFFIFVFTLEITIGRISNNLKQQGPIVEPHRIIIKRITLSKYIKVLKSKMDDFERKQIWL